jgi:uncharacterized OB-fold protein
MLDRVTRAPALENFTLTVDFWTKPFWDAAAQHKLTALRCGSCGTFRMPPTPFCPKCTSQSACWPELSGGGSIFSYTIVERAPLPKFEHCVPYAPALIELDDAPGVRLISNIVGARLDALAVGARVKVGWSDGPHNVSVPHFVLDG